MRSIRCIRIPWGLCPVCLNVVMLFCGHEKKKEIFVLVPEMYWNDVEVLRQLNIQFKNTCIWWWPRKVSAYIFIHTFSIVQAWQDINSQVVHINQFSILNAFHVILLSTEYTIHFYKKIHLFNQAFAKQSAITRGLIELNSYRILAQPMAQCEQHTGTDEFRDSSSSISFFILKLISMEKKIQNFFNE